MSTALNNFLTTSGDDFFAVPKLILFTGQSNVTGTEITNTL